MHSYILNGYPENEIITAISSLSGIPLSSENFFTHPDIIIVKPHINEKTINKKASITIEMVRHLQTKLLKKPLILPLQLAVVFGAQHLTLSAQNAFLKLLEEPQEQTYLFLVTANTASLLPTIQSRCQIVQPKAVDTNNFQDNSEEIDLLTKMTVGERMSALEQYAKTHNDALSWLENTARNLRQKMVKYESQDTVQKLASILEKIQAAHQDISYNINIKLSLDVLAIGWSREVRKA